MPPKFQHPLYDDFTLRVISECAGKMQRQWAQRGAWEGFRDHVLEAARPYESAVVNPGVTLVADKSKNTSWGITGRSW